MADTIDVKILDSCGNPVWWNIPKSYDLKEGDDFNEQLLPAGSFKYSTPPNTNGGIRCRSIATTTQSTTSSTTTGGTNGTTNTTANTTAPINLCQRGPTIAGFSLESKKSIRIYYDAQGVNVITWTINRIVNSLPQIYKSGTTDPLQTNNFYINLPEDMPDGNYAVDIKSPYCVSNPQAGQITSQAFTVKTTTTTTTETPLTIVGLRVFETRSDDATTTSQTTVLPLCQQGPSIYGLTALDNRRIQLTYDAKGVNNLNWQIIKGTVIQQTGNTGILTTNTFVITLGFDMQDGIKYQIVIDSPTCRANSQGTDSNIREFVYSAGITQTTTTTKNAGSLRFKIVSYDYLTGTLQFAVSSSSSAAVNLTIPGLYDSNIALDTVVTRQIPVDQRNGTRFIGTAIQAGVSIPVDFTTKPDLAGPTTTTQSTTTQSTTTQSTTQGTTGTNDGIPATDKIIYTRSSNSSDLFFRVDVERNNGYMRLKFVPFAPPSGSNKYWLFVSGQQGVVDLNTDYTYIPGDRIIMYVVESVDPFSWVFGNLTTKMGSAVITLGLAAAPTP